MVREGNARRFPWAIVVVAVVLLALAAMRALIGASTQDDSYYVAATLRLAHGARIFTDEMMLQTGAFLLGVPFAKVWTAIFGTAGIVAALRLFFVALAAAVAALIQRVLRPSFGPWPALLAPAIVVLAPPYNLLAMSYNTMTVLGLVLACALAFAAVRDSSRTAAAGAGAAAAVAAISYPPMVVTAFALLAAFAFVTRGRRLTWALVAGAAAVVAIFGVYLATQATLAGLGATASFVTSSWALGGGGGPLGRIVALLTKLSRTLQQGHAFKYWMSFVPAAVATVVALAVPGDEAWRVTARRWAIASIPLLLVLPVAAYWFLHRHEATAITLGANYLIGLTAFLLLPMLVSLRDARRDMRTLASIAVPVGIVGLLCVDAVSNSGIVRGSGITGLAPLTAAVIVWWVAAVADAFPRAWVLPAATLTVTIVVLLFGSAYVDAAPIAMDATIASGPYAGIRTSAAHAAEFAEVRALAGRWIRPDTTYLAPFGQNEVYVLARGRAYTNTVWLALGPSDASTVRYFESKGAWPDVVFLPRQYAAAVASASPVATSDALLSHLVGRYTQVDSSAAANTAVLVRR